MDIEIYWKHVGILLGFILVGSLFTFSFLYSEDPNQLTGYVTLDNQVKVSTSKLDRALINEINRGEHKPKVIIILETDNSINQEQQIENIKQTQQEVLEDLETITQVTDETINEQEESNTILTNKYETINALALEVTGESLKQLSQNNKVKKILLDYPVKATLDESIVQINANQIQNISYNNQYINGTNQNVCVIDTGIDYTHEAFGSCNPINYTTTGNEILLTNATQSDHNYNNSFDYTWTIENENVSQIAIHFVNISLESPSGAGDALDRVHVYDQLNQTVAIYKGNLTDVWTPYANGSKMYVRLITDGSVTDYGFYVDKILNGTTNTTVNWSNCESVIGGYDFVNNDANPQDDQGHGTHVSGIIASNNNTYKGVAPGSKIISIKALDSAGSGYSSDVLSGLDWCNSNRNKLNISIISLSLGCDGASCTHYQSHCTSDITQSGVNNSFNNNISVFIASGNSGWTNGISNPGCTQNAIPIGGATAADAIVYNRGTLLELLAPANSITSTQNTGGYTSMSGTSMATPHAAGAAALIKQYFNQVHNQDLTPTQIKNKLIKGSTTISDDDSSRTYYRFDVLNAIKPTFNVSNTSRTDSSLINITSQYNLNNSILQWTYPNSTTTNYTMNQSSQTNYYYNQTDLVNGTHVINVYSSDLAQTQNETGNINLIIGTPSPAINIISPLNNSYHSSNFILNLSMNGTTFEYNITNDSNYVFANNTTNSTYDTTIDISNYTDNNYTLTVKASSAQSTSATTIYTFTIDTKAPQIYLITNNSNTTDENQNITLNFTTNDINMNHTIISTNFSFPWTNTTLNQTGNITYNFTGLRRGELSYYFVAIDKAGNINKTILYNLTVTQDNTNITTNRRIQVDKKQKFEFVTSLTGSLSYLWDFGDNTTSTDKNPKKKYNESKIYNVSLKISNSSNTQIDNLSFYIGDVNAPTFEVDYKGVIHTATTPTLSVKADVTDDNNISLIDIEYNNSKTGTCDGNTTTWNCSWSLSKINAGINNFTIKVKDIQNNSYNKTYTFVAYTCSDGLASGGEVRVDCGGPCANSCSTSIDEDYKNAGAGQVGIQEENQQEQSLEVNANEESIETSNQDSKTVEWKSDLVEQTKGRKQGTLYAVSVIIMFFILVYVALAKSRITY
jgi:subtilisin family serine protease